MAFNRKTYHRNQCLNRAKRAIIEGKRLRAGTHDLCKVLTPDRIAQSIAIAVSDARYYRNLAKLP